MKAIDVKTAAYRAACTALVIAQGKEDTLRQSLYDHTFVILACKEAVEKAERALLDEARSAA